MHHAAEKLYQQGYLSYPRTETDIFPDTMDLADLVRLQTNDPRWGQFAGNLIAPGAPRITPRRGKNDDKSHPPIHPTKVCSLQAARPMAEPACI